MNISQNLNNNQREDVAHNLTVDKREIFAKGGQKRFSPSPSTGGLQICIRRCAKLLGCREVIQIGGVKQL